MAMLRDQRAECSVALFVLSITAGIDSFDLLLWERASAPTGQSVSLSGLKSLPQKSECVDGWQSDEPLFLPL